jgi:hypothetical protein
VLTNECIDVLIACRIANLRVMGSLDLNGVQDSTLNKTFAIRDGIHEVNELEELWPEDECPPDTIVSGGLEKLIIASSTRFWLPVYAILTPHAFILQQSTVETESVIPMSTVTDVVALQSSTNPYIWRPPDQDWNRRSLVPSPDEPLSFWCFAVRSAGDARSSILRTRAPVARAEWVYNLRCAASAAGRAKAAAERARLGTWTRAREAARRIREHRWTTLAMAGLVGVDFFIECASKQLSRAQLEDPGVVSVRRGGEGGKGGGRERQRRAG